MALALRSFPRILPALALIVVLSGCGAEGSVSEIASDPTPDRWDSAGFVEMTPAIRPPTSADGADVIQVWLRLPEGPSLRVVDAGAGPKLVMPVGTEADRVELQGHGKHARVLDVRGTRFLAEGEEFHMERPANGRLSGVAWPRDNPRAQKLADEHVAEMAGPKAADWLVKLNQCAFCHTPNKAENVRVNADGLPNRATDGSGLYHPQAVLDDETPIEASRPHDQNIGDPFIRLRCRDGRAHGVRKNDDGSLRPFCPDGSPPLARLDVRAALAAGDAHAKAVCASRRYLFEHLTVEDRAAFRGAFDACSLSDDLPESVSKPEN